MTAVVPASVLTFIADLAEHGVEGQVQGPAVVYSVMAVAGGRAGQSVPTGVSINELTAWPAVPPHWVHFPMSVAFAHSNTDSTDCLEGWQRHSRDIGNWSPNRPPILNWLAHVRGVAAGAAS